MSYSKVDAAVSAILSPLFRKSTVFIPKRSSRLLNIGCGRYPKPDFINLDYEWHPGVDVCWDVTKGLPFGDSSMDGVFTEHCLEHLPYSAIHGVLKEVRRVLAPMGTFRISVPDGEAYLRGYAMGKALPLADRDSADGIYSPIKSVNRVFRDFAHLYAYDFDLLRQLLLKHGFANVQRVDFGAGRDSRLLVDRTESRPESLYIEAWTS